MVQEFFYNSCKPIAENIHFQILKSYKTEVDVRDISSIIYRKCWESDFARLKSYIGDCSIFYWIAQIASQVVFDDLEKSGIIKKSHALTTKNTSLCLKSLKSDDERIAILELITEPLWHNLLTDIYLYRKSEEDIKLKYDLTDEAYSEEVKLAENLLKTRLIEEEVMLWHRPLSSKNGKAGADSDTNREDKFVMVNLVSEALGELAPKLRTTSSLEAMREADKIFNDNGIFDEIHDVLWLWYPNLTPKEMWSRLLEDHASKCGMGPTMLEVWKARHIYKESPVELAQSLGIRRSAVDNLFAKGNKLLVAHIKNFWRQCS